MYTKSKWIERDAMLYLSKEIRNNFNKLRDRKVFRVMM